MLCSGIFTLFILPVPYSLFNGLFIAFICCIILYLVALESEEKKRLKKENATLHKEITELLDKEVSAEEKLLKLCEEKGISDRDTKIAIMYYIERKKPRQILEWLCTNNQNMSMDSVYILLNRLNKKLKNQKC
jgi:hypothetical protein